MNSEEQAKQRRDDERLALEAERLRNDEPFAKALTAAKNDTVAQLARAEQALVQAVLTHQDTGVPEYQVRLLQAKSEAIDALSTEIANIIIRGATREIKPVA